MISNEEIEQLINALGFSPENNGGNSKTWSKTYSKNDDSPTIKIDFDKRKIYYDEKIEKGDETTSNFESSENFVVLECVNRLLEKGYKASKIELEHKWSMGRKLKGKLDVLVRDEQDKTYLMIECKTYGDEYSKETDRMLADGGQLFSYFQQDRNAKFLCLYTSRLNNGAVEFENKIIEIKQDYLKLNEVKEIYARWNKQFDENGIFEEDVNPYKIEIKPIYIKDLKEIKDGDANRIYNEFLEILRHNVVSDKPNAFNKIFNLFLCKVYDEDYTSDNEPAEFQWIKGKDNDIQLLSKLNSLYKKGMQQFLKKEITDYEDNDLENKLLNLTDDAKKQIEKMFIELRLYKNNEFSFIDVYNEASFKENARVVREIVELLQRWKIRYAHKQQFLGEFFEKLLSTGFKQESGQFFTPTLLARFVINSIPIKEFIHKNAQANKPNIIPYVIDFACGSGHFLTEAMDIIHNHLLELDTTNLSKAMKDEVNVYKSKNFSWAEKYIYGIEKDYRLVKTSKISCFLNGDGEANIIHEDGLAMFGSERYIGKLENKTKKDNKNNMEFDILIANPPYSISGFKNTIVNGANDFELFANMTDTSSEIEVLFIERMKQLLKVGGYAGIVLPNSILSNGGNYSKAREMILKYFNIKGITVFGNNAFMATGINTIILFLERNSNDTHKNKELEVDKFIKNWEDTNNQIFSSYAKTYDKNINEYKEYYLSLNNENKGIENYKLLIYNLCYEQKITIVKSGEKDAEKDFLGYEFSNRRGYEGIHKRGEGKLFDEHNLRNSKKANSYIYKQFLNEQIEQIDDELQNNVFIQNLVDCFDWQRSDFELQINVNNNSKKKANMISKYEFVKLENVIKTLESGSRPKGGVGGIKQGAFSLGGEHINLLGEVDFANEKYVPIDFYISAKKGFLQHNDILICKDGALTGKVALFSKNECKFEKIMINEHVFLLRSNDKALQLYLFQILFSEFGQILLKENITGSGQGGLNQGNLKQILIPLPPLNIQEKIVSEIQEIEQIETKYYHTITQKQNEIKQAIDECKSYPLEFIENLVENVFVGGDVPQNSFSLSKTEQYSIPIYSNSLENEGLYGYTNIKKITDIPCITVVGRGYYVGKAFIRKEPFYPIVRLLVVVPKSNININYFKHVINTIDFTVASKGTPQLPAPHFKRFQIPIPPLEIQNEVANKILSCEKEIDEANEFLNNSKQQKQAILNKYLT